MKGALLAVTAALALTAPPAGAATFTVTTDADAPGVCAAGVCTLRAALAATGETPEADTVVLGAGDYALVLGELAVAGDVTIQGAGARTTKVLAGATGRVLNVGAGTVKIGHATLSGGNADEGGVLLNAGTLELDHVRVTGGAAADGGGIANHGTLTLDHGLVDANQGGGVLNAGALTVRDSTVALNTGGGIRGGTATLDRVTVARNTGGGVSGDAIRLSGSLLAANLPSDCGAGLVTGGGNVASSSGCGFGVNDRVVADPKLGAGLVNAGGETDVLRLAPDSEAQDYSGACASADQRDLVRPQAAGCDPGAYEIEAVQLTGPQGPTASRDVELGFTAAPGSDFRCTLDGDDIDACTSPQDFHLADGPHTFTVQAVHGDEPLSDVVERRFTVDTAAPAAPVVEQPAGGSLATTPSTAVDGRVAAPVVTPAFRKTVVLRPSTGRTSIKRRGATAFEELHGKTAVPLGTTVDAHAGVVVVTAAPAAGAAPQSAQFSGGVFTVTQPDGATELALSGALRCGTTRRLSGDGAGAFRIRGRFGAATARGAKWLVQDSCKATVVRVTRGVVAMRDDRTHKTVLVRAGRRYETRPKA